MRVHVRDQRILQNFCKVAEIGLLQLSKLQALCPKNQFMFSPFPIFCTRAVLSLNCSMSFGLMVTGMKVLLADFRDSKTTVSTWSVWGNMSTGWQYWAQYPFFNSCFISRT